MPVFPLNGIPGLSGSIEILEGAANVSVSVGLKDALLFLPGSQTVAMQASHRRISAGRHEIRLEAALSPPGSFCGGQVTLSSLGVTIRYDANPAGPVFNPAMSDSVQAAGTAKWAGAQALGIANGADLTVSYQFSPGAGSGFTLALANPVPLPGNLARIDSGQIRLELPATRPVAVLTVAGAASLTANGENQARQLLGAVLGQPSQIQPLRGSYTVELALENGKLPPAARAVGDPVFQFDLNWAAGFQIPQLANIPAGLALDLGLPTLRLPLPSGSVPGNWTLAFRNGGIRFPQVRGIETFRISGSFWWETGAVNRLVIEPDLAGVLDLPAILQVLIARLRWLQSKLSLAEILEAAKRSVLESEWEDLIRALLPTPFPSTPQALAALEQAVRSAMNAAASAGLEIERVLALAFRAFSEAGQEAQELLWRVLYSDAAWVAKLPQVLLALLARQAAACNAAVRALFAHPPAGLDLETLLKALLNAWGANLGQVLHLGLWSRIVVLAADNLPEPRLRDFIEALNAALRDVSWMQQRWGVAAPGVLSGLMTLLARADQAAGQVILKFTVLCLTLACRGVQELLETREPFASAMRGLASQTGALLDALGFSRYLTIMQMLLGPFSGLTPEQRRAREERILCAAHADPLFGALMVLAYMPVALLVNRSDALDLASKPVNTQEGRNVKTLPKGSYLILSDVHRDAASDRRPPLEIGSIHHFTANQQLYLDVLEWADTNNFTVLEGGDGEELWFIRDPAEHNQAHPVTGHTGFKKKLGEILETHRGVYDKLRSLHHRKRYFRIYGNHDSYLRDPDMFALLKDEMEKPIPGTPVEPFNIYEFFVIDGVKKMTESRLLALVSEIVAAPASQRPDKVKNLGALLTSLGLGMDPADYTETVRMLVAHGHQWDFFNCDSNNLLGKLISNAIAVKLDRVLDVAVDARGVALCGSPTLDFADILANVFILENWPDQQPAVKLAHRIQHMANAERLMADSLIYNETLATVLGTMFTAVNWLDPATGQEVTPQQSRAGLASGRITALEYLRRHHSHHLALGHTHNPQSQPYFRLLPFLQELPLVRDVVALMDAFFPIKSQYFNSGTSGWMTGVVWGILIDAREDCQARLVFWTKKSREPEYMDWELRPLDPNIKAAIQARFQSFADVLNLIGELAGEAGINLDGLGPALKRTLALPQEVLAAGMLEQAGETNALEVDLVEAAPGDTAAMATALRQLHWLVVTALNASLGKGLAGVTTAREFKVRIPAPASFRQTVQRLSSSLSGLGGAAGAAALPVACAMELMLRDFPRNLPFFGLAADRFDPVKRLAGSAQPVLTAAVSLLPLLPLTAQNLNPLSRPIETHAAFNGDQLEVTIKVG